MSAIAAENHHSAWMAANDVTAGDRICSYNIFTPSTKNAAPSSIASGRRKQAVVARLPRLAAPY